LIDWAKGRGKFANQTPGYHHIAEYLWTLELEHRYNPMFHKRAPATSSRPAAIAASLGSAEQDVVDAISEGVPGFRGGFISSTRLDALFKSTNKRIPKGKLADIAETLGFIQHPHLIDGRVNNPVMPDGTRTRLFVHKSELDILALKDHAAIAHRYTMAQLAS
jgi:hypothetical protein